MNDKRNLVGILTTSTILAGCNLPQKNDNVLIGDYRFEKEAIEYLDEIHERKNKNPSIEDYLNLGRDSDVDKNKYVSKEEVRSYIESIIASVKVINTAH